MPESKISIPESLKEVLTIMGFQCKRCGECCHDVPMMFRLKDPTAKELEFWKVRGMDVQEVEGEIRLYVKRKCPQLKGENQCRIYGKHPEMCKTWDCRFMKEVNHATR